VRGSATLTAALLCLAPHEALAESAQERVAAAVAEHNYGALQAAAAELALEPGYATAAAAATDFARLALRGEPAASHCRSAGEQAEAIVYLTELSRLLERSLRFEDAARCLVRASELVPSSERREVAARALVRAGLEAEASSLLSQDGDTALLAEVDGLAGRQVVSSEQWSELRWVASGEGAEGFGATVEVAYAAFVSATGGRLAAGVTVERLAPAVRARTRLAGLSAEGAVGITLGRLVSLEEGLPAAVEQEVVWHELAHAFLAVRAPYGGPSWLGEAVAFAWSRALLQAAGIAPVTVVDGPAWTGWIAELEQSDAAVMDGPQRAARDAFAARLGSWFASRFGMEALLSVYAASSQGEPVEAAFARLSGLSSAELRAAFEAGP
jgi:hypothetical protein